MRITLSTFAVVVGLGLLPAPASFQEKGGDDVTGPYNVVEKWPLPLSVAKPGYIWGSTGGIFAETPNRIFIANRGELKLPEKLPNNFTGFWGSFGQQATTPTPEFRNCIVIVDATGKVTPNRTRTSREPGRLARSSRPPLAEAVSAVAETSPLAPSRRPLSSHRPGGI